MLNGGEIKGLVAKCIKHLTPLYFDVSLAHVFLENFDPKSPQPHAGVKICRCMKGKQRFEFCQKCSNPSSKRNMDRLQDV